LNTTVVSKIANHFEFYSGLRGYHVYKNTADWKPYEKEKVTLKREINNEHDKFAVAGRVTMRGKFGWIIVGHIPRELSRYVYRKKPIASPLLQGGLEIPIKVSVTWDCPENLEILIEKVKDVQYPIVDGTYIDSSKDILKELVGDDLDENNSDCEMDDEIELIEE